MTHPTVFCSQGDSVRVLWAGLWPSSTSTAFYHLDKHTHGMVSALFQHVVCICTRSPQYDFCIYTCCRLAPLLSYFRPCHVQSSGRNNQSTWLCPEPNRNEWGTVRRCFTSTGGETGSPMCFLTARQMQLKSGRKLEELGVTYIGVRSTNLYLYFCETEYRYRCQVNTKAHGSHCTP